jgi:hypothetical protein
MVDPPVGAALSPQISDEDFERGERDIDAFVSRRHRQREREEGRRREEELWKASCEAEEREQQEALRHQWESYHWRAAERHRETLVSLINHHEREAARYAEQEAPDTHKEHD